jgi:phage replication-related protein YjqB (UPF0714/DUF867 family)
VGKQEELKQNIMAALRAGGFDATMDEVPELLGIDPDNLCNRCRTGKGVQLELARGLREKLFNQPNHRSLRSKTLFFYKFVNILKEVIR